MSEDSDAISNNVISMPMARASGKIGSGPLLPPPGGGGVDGIEARLAKLEASQEFIQRRLDMIDGRLDTISSSLVAIQVSLAKLEERTASKGFVITVVLAALAVLAGLSVFGDQIRALIVA